MSALAPLPRYSLFLRLLRISLVTGAVFELAVAALMILTLVLPALPLAPSLADEALCVWLVALFLILLNACYLQGAWDPVACPGAIAVAIVGRAAVAVVLGFTARSGSEPGGLVVLAVAELALALAHAACWLPIRR